MKRSNVLVLLSLAACHANVDATDDPNDAPPDAGAAAFDAAYVKEHGRLLVNRMDASTNRASISIRRADGTNEQLVTNDGLSPSWTPDGRILFASSRSGSQQVWIANADGTNARQLTQLAPDVLPVMPQLGNNGLVVFMGRDAETQPDSNTGIWTIREDGTQLQKLTRGMQPFMAPSGTWIAFTLQTDEPYHRQIWRINTDGTGLQQLTFLGDPEYPDANAPAISPNEQTVAFFSGKESARAVPGAPPDSIFEWGNRNVALVPAAGGTRTTITPCRPVRTMEELQATSAATGKCVAADNPSWSPDGGWLVFDVGFYAGTETWLVDVAGKDFQQFVPEPRGVSRVPLRYPEQPSS